MCRSIHTSSVLAPKGTPDTPRSPALLMLTKPFTCRGHNCCVLLPCQPGSIASAQSTSANKPTSRQSFPNWHEPTCAAIINIHTKKHGQCATLGGQRLSLQTCKVHLARWPYNKPNDRFNTVHHLPAEHSFLSAAPAAKAAHTRVLQQLPMVSSNYHTHCKLRSRNSPHTQRYITLFIELWREERNKQHQQLHFSGEPVQGCS